MTYNTQELDEILTRLENMVEGFTVRRVRGNTRDMVSPKSIHAEAKQAILDWHNKQIEAVLDRLEAQCGETIDNTLGKPIRIKFVSVSAIEAERNKLEAEL